MQEKIFFTLIFFINLRSGFANQIEIRGLTSESK